MPLDSPLDYIDYTSLRFPSDRITLLDIRRAHPERFDVEDGRRFKDTNDDEEFLLNTIVYLERLVARAAFEAALGKPTDIYTERGLGRDVCIAELAGMYVRYGASTGIEHTRQLVCDLETQAATQATGKRS